LGERLFLLDELLNLTNKISPKIAENYAKQILKESSHLPRVQKLVHAKVLLSKYMFLSGKSDSCMLLARQTLREARLLKYDRGIWRSYMYLAAAHKSKMNKDSSLVYDKLGYEYYDSNEENEEYVETKAIFSARMGTTYLSLGELDLALQYFKECISFNEVLGRKDITGIIHNNVAVIYSKKADYDKSLENFKKALSIARETGNKINQLHA